MDEYKQWKQSRGEILNNEEINNRTQEFISHLKSPGIHEIGGLGACTLMSRKALESGVNFHPISNLSFWGEDRHFCIRAVVLGYKLYVDTHLPAFHLYLESDLIDAEAFITKTQVHNKSNKKQSPSFQMDRPKLTLSMIAKNESNLYFNKVLEEHLRLVLKSTAAPTITT